MSLDRSSSRHSLKESNTSPASPEPPPPLYEQPKIAKDLQSKYKRQYRNIKRDQADLAACKMCELLDVEVETTYKDLKYFAMTIHTTLRLSMSSWRY